MKTAPATASGNDNRPSKWTARETVAATSIRNRSTGRIGTRPYLLTMNSDNVAPYQHTAGHCVKCAEIQQGPAPSQ